MSAAWESRFADVGLEFLQHGHQTGTTHDKRHRNGPHMTHILDVDKKHMPEFLHKALADYAKAYVAKHRDTIDARARRHEVKELLAEFLDAHRDELHALYEQWLAQRDSDTRMDHIAGKHFATTRMRGGRSPFFWDSLWRTPDYIAADSPGTIEAGTQQEQRMRTQTMQRALDTRVAARRFETRHQPTWRSPGEYLTADQYRQIFAPNLARKHAFTESSTIPFM